MLMAFHFGRKWTRLINMIVDTVYRNPEGNAIVVLPIWVNLRRFTEEKVSLEATDGQYYLFDC